MCISVVPVQPLLLRLPIVFCMCVPPSFPVCHFCGVLLAQRKALSLSSFKPGTLEELSFCIYKWLIVSS